jgi:hypothetical protein
MPTIHKKTGKITYHLKPCEYREYDVYGIPYCSKKNTQEIELEDCLTCEFGGEV